MGNPGHKARTEPPQELLDERLHNGPYQNEPNRDLLGATTRRTQLKKFQKTLVHRYNAPKQEHQAHASPSRRPHSLKQHNHGPSEDSSPNPPSRADAAPRAEATTATKSHQRRPRVEARRGLSQENTRSTSGSSTSMATRPTPQATNSARRERSARHRRRRSRQG